MQKQRERLFLDEFRICYSDFPLGKIIGHEAPDFLIQDASFRTVGIELVEYVRGQNTNTGSIARRNEMLQQQIATTAKAIYDTVSQIPLLVHFLWKDFRQLKKADVSRIASDVIEVVVQNIPTALFQDGAIRLGYNELASTSLAELLVSLHITRVRNQDQSSWMPIGVGFISVTAGEIQKLILGKDAKVEEYLTKCDSVWLLIVAEGWHISSTVAIPECIRNQSFESKFERVFLFDRMSRKITKLKTPVIGGV